MTRVPGNWERGWESQQSEIVLDAGQRASRLLRDNFLSLFCGLPQSNVKIATQRFISSTADKQASRTD